MNIKPSLGWETLWHVVVFFITLGAAIPLWREAAIAEFDPATGDLIQRLILAGAYLAVGLLVFHWRKAISMALRFPVVWILLGWAFLSILWSPAQEITLRRATSALLATLYGLLLTVRYPFRSVIVMLGWAISIAMTASLIAVILFPSWGLMGEPHPGTWQGVFFHKNALGRISVLGLMVSLFLSSEAEGLSRWGWIALMAASGTALIGSRSTTALVLAVTVAVTWTVLPLLRRERIASVARFFPIAIVLLIVGLIWLSGYLEAGLNLLGEDPSLTGRVPLWKTLIPIALDRPFLGYGYGAFWLGESGPSASVWATIQWNPPHAHNGLLQLWLEIGLIGLTLAVIMWAVAMTRSFRQADRNYWSDELRYIVTFMVFFAVMNLVQAIWFEAQLANVAYWIIFVHLCFSAGTLRFTNSAADS